MMLRHSGHSSLGARPAEDMVQQLLSVYRSMWEKAN